jgi:predicted transcriptional regulator
MSDLYSADPLNSDLLGYTSEIVASYIKQNQIPQGDLPGLIRSVFAALGGISLPAAAAAPAELKPAVSVRKSITDDYLICLEDGAKLKMLKRYLLRQYDLTPDQYRAKWNLPSDYPMVAPNYAALRSDMAKRIGLGKQAPASGRGRRKAT